MDIKKGIIAGTCFALFFAIGFGFVKLTKKHEQESPISYPQPIVDTSWVDRGVVRSFSEEVTEGKSAFRVTYDITRKDCYVGDKLIDSTIERKETSREIIKVSPTPSPIPPPIPIPDPKPADPKYSNEEFKKMMVKGDSRVYGGVIFETKSVGLDENESKPTSVESINDKISTGKWKDFSVELRCDSAGNPVKAIITAKK